MFRKVLFSLFINIVVQQVLTEGHQDSYAVPEPLIEVSKTRGFNVSIPHSDGVTLFAFHGNINKPLENLEAGEYSKDILRRHDNRWTYQNNVRKLHVGDKIYFWLYALKDGLGYRYDDGIYEVKEVLEDDHHLQTTETPHSLQSAQLDWSFPSDACSCNTPSHRPVKPEPSVGFCERALLNLTQITVNLQSEIDSLRDENNILQDIAEKQPTSSRTLKVDGRIPTNDDPLDTVQAIIRERLHLPITVVRATRNPNKRIIFEVGSIREKMSVIKAAKEKLKDTEIFISY